MGTLNSILFDDDFDFSVLFTALCKAKFCIGDLARFACSCKLTRAWVRFQLSKCTFEHICKFLWRMRATVGPYGRRVPQKDPSKGELLWMHYAEPDAHVLHEADDSFTGILVVTGNEYNKTEGIWYCRQCSGAVDKPRLNPYLFSSSFQGEKSGYACFPMFDTQILQVIRRTDPVDEEDKQLLKKARLEGCYGRGSSVMV